MNAVRPDRRGHLGRRELRHVDALGQLQRAALAVARAQNEVQRRIGDADAAEQLVSPVPGADSGTVYTRSGSGKINVFTGRDAPLRRMNMNGVSGEVDISGSGGGENASIFKLTYYADAQTIANNTNANVTVAHNGILDVDTKLPGQAPATARGREDRRRRISNSQVQGIDVGADLAGLRAPIPDNEHGGRTREASPPAQGVLASPWPARAGSRRPSSFQ